MERPRDAYDRAMNATFDARTIYRQAAVKWCRREGPLTGREAAAVEHGYDQAWADCLSELAKMGALRVPARAEVRP